jgi:hypothetical protein
MSLQGPQSEEALRRLDDYEQRVDLFAEQARDYWRLWGALGEHMVRGIDGWANQQHSYLQWLRQNHGDGHRPQTGETPEQRLPPPQ